MKVSLAPYGGKDFYAHILRNDNVWEVWIFREGYGAAIFSYGSEYIISAEEVSLLDKQGYFYEHKEELANLQ